MHPTKTKADNSHVCISALSNVTSEVTAHAQRVARALSTARPPLRFSHAVTSLRSARLRFTRLLIYAARTTRVSCMFH
jgi:hypothetical protein